MISADIDAVTSVYAEVLDPSYISFSELGEGKAKDSSTLSPHAPSIFREQLAHLLHSSQHGFFVATVNNELVGFALASLHKAEAGHMECWLDDLGIRRNWRGQGIAKTLVSQVFNWGAEERVSYYLLESGVRNESAHHLFETLGFQPLSTVFWRRGGTMPNEAIGGVNKRLASQEVRYVESEAELREVSNLDASFYGGESINHEGLLAWWQAYKKGIYVLRKDENIIGAIGIWPVKKAAFDKLIKGELDEVDLTAQDISGSVTGQTCAYWYFADIVLKKQYHDTPEDLALFLIEETLSQWLIEGGLASRIHVCALGFEAAGIKLLERYNFQFAEGKPVWTPRGKPAYMRTLADKEIQQEIDNLHALRIRRLIDAWPTPVAEEPANIVEKDKKQIKILFLAASPKDTKPLKLQREIEAIKQALQQSRYRDGFVIEQHWEMRVDRLAERLLWHNPDIVHFSGHGSAASEIILEDKRGLSHPVSVEELSKLFSLLKDNIRCVILNACYSEVQAQAIASHIDCVVGMSEAIDDDSAIIFAASFYGALGYGRNVKTAFEVGRLQLDLENMHGHNVPKLICKRPEAESTVFVFDVV
jgi:GNAT superfamily N-acetyltransferase